MNADFNRLESKIDALQALVEEIAKTLNHAIILPKITKLPPPKNRIKNELKEHQALGIEKDLILMFTYQNALQKQFNLFQTPSLERIKSYLSTNNPSVFDGLKRKLK